VQGFVHIKTLNVEGGQAQLLGQAQCQFAYLFNRVLDHHLKQTYIWGGSGAAECDGAARLNL
jgi:hypothetical protein